MCGETYCGVESYFHRHLIGRVVKMNRIPSAIAVVRTMSNALLMLKRVETDRSYPGRWCFPGGCIDDGERAEQTALRELREETGIAEADVIKIDLVTQEESPLPARNIVYQISIFSVQVRNDVKVIISGEHSAFAFLTPENAIKLDLAGPVTESIIRGMLDGK